MKIKIFTVTKNEYDLIEYWTLFYGSIFGYENLTIIDTGSDNKIVLNFYEKIKKNTQINIYKENSFNPGEQGKYFTKYMHTEKSDSDFLLGCDTDNFLILRGTNKIIKEDYFRFFESLPKEQNKFLIHSSIDSIIDSNSPNYINNKYNNPIMDCDKFINHATVCANFYRTKAFVNTSDGNHIGETSPDQIAFNCSDKLVYIHYNYTGLSRCMERSIEICEGYQYFNLKYPLSYYDNAKINYENICKAFNNINAGTHRYIICFSYISRYFIYSLFKKYVTEEYFKIENFYNILYCNENFLNNKQPLNKQPLNKYINNFTDEKKYSIIGDTSFIKYRLQYSIDNIEDDFINFFKLSKFNNNSHQTKFKIEDIFNNDESIYYSSLSNNEIKITCLKTYLKKITF